ncbi:MAG: DUF1893 domain-containing protein [Petrotogales bacterium]
MVSDEIIRDMDSAREVMHKTDVSIVVVKNGDIVAKKKGDGIKPILETVDEMGEELQGSILGDRILGKASAFLCAYAKVAGVYAPQATKTAIAVLIRAGITGQTDEIVPYVKNRTGDGLCPFEQLLTGIDSPDEAYTVLKRNFEKIG